MMKRYLFPALLFAIMLHTASAFALTCKNDYAGASGCAANATSAGDCATIGYSKTEDPDCGHYVLCPFDSTYKRCVSKKCTNYTLSACPENGICVSCQSAETVTYALAGCKSGFAVGPNNTCVTSYSSCEAAGHFSDNTNRVCAGDTVIYITGSNPVKCFTGCECASGYVDVSGVCIKTYATCEDAGYHTIGTGASCASEASIYTSDTDASQTATCCTVETKCPDTYVKDIAGNCVCGKGYVEIKGEDESVCVQAYANCEAASYYTIGEHMQCSDSDKVSIYLTDASQKECCGVETTCEAGLVKDTNNQCVKAFASCAEASYFDDNNFRNCTGTTNIYLNDGSQKSCYVGCTCQQWYEEDSSGQCVPKQCPSGTSTSTACFGNKLSVATGSYSGTSACYECQTCSKNYATDARYCSTSSPQGWTLSLTDKDGIGCRKCTPKACPEGSSTSPTCMSGQEIVEAGHTGDEICYKCVGEASVTPTVTCETAGCTKGQYLCYGKCSNIATAPEPDCVFCRGTDSGTQPPLIGGGGGGSIDNNPCIGPGDNSCECILYKDRFFCNNHPDNVCCDTVEKEDSTDTGITINP